MEHTNDTRSQKQWDSNQAYGYLTDSFQGMGRTIYPSFYSGAYLNEDAKLVVLTTDTSKAHEVHDRAGDNSIILSGATYSYTALNETMEAINTFLLANPEHPVAQNIASASLREAENLIVVELRDDCEQQRQQFGKACTDFPGIRFTKMAEEPVANIAQVPVGSYASGSSFAKNASFAPLSVLAGGKVNRGNAYCSMGFRCYQYKGSVSQRYGFTLAGHCASLNTLVYTADDVPIGVCTNSQYGGLDASFISRFNDAVDLSNEIHASGGWTHLQQTTSYAVGSTVYKAGVTTGLTSGIVQSINATVQYNNSSSIKPVTVTNMLEHSASSNGGDSGGITFVHRSSTENYPIGVHSGRGYYSYACQWSYFTQTFGLSL